MPRGGPQRGDYTGQERERLMKEQAQELEKRQQEIGLANRIDTVTEEEGIFDPASGDLVEMSAETQAKISALNEPIEVDEDPILDPSLPLPGYDPMKNLQETQIQQKIKAPAQNRMEIEDLGPEPETVVVDREWRVIRVNTDIEEMTYGVGNHLTFLRGKRYRVPPDLYVWLESRGVVYH